MTHKGRSRADKHNRASGKMGRANREADSPYVSETAHDESHVQGDNASNLLNLTLHESSHVVTTSLTNAVDGSGAGNVLWRRVVSFDGVTISGPGVVVCATETPQRMPKNVRSRFATTASVVDPMVRLRIFFFFFISCVLCQSLALTTRGANATCARHVSQQRPALAPPRPPCCLFVVACSALGRTDTRKAARWVVNKWQVDAQAHEARAPALCDTSSVERCPAFPAKASKWASLKRPAKAPSQSLLVF